MELLSIADKPGPNSAKKLLPMAPRTQDFIAGVLAQLPLQLGVVPFGLVFGILGLASGLTPLQTVLMSSILFGGASQVVFAQLWSLGTSALVTGSSVAVINLRHVLYSASLAKYLHPLPLRWRIVLGYLLTDEAFAVSVKRFETAPKWAHYHLLGSGLTLWVFWQAATVAGVLVGKEIPADWNLDFAIPLTFIAIIVPNLRNIPQIAAALSAGYMAILAHDLPHNIWIIVAGLTGIIVGGALTKERASS